MVGPKGVARLVLPRILPVVPVLSSREMDVWVGSQAHRAESLSTGRTL